MTHLKSKSVTVLATAFSALLLSACGSGFGSGFGSGSTSAQTREQAQAVSALKQAHSSSSRQAMSMIGGGQSFAQLGDLSSFAGAAGGQVPQLPTGAFELPSSGATGSAPQLPTQIPDLTPIVNELKGGLISLIEKNGAVLQSLPEEQKQKYIDELEAAQTAFSAIDMDMLPAQVRPLFDAHSDILASLAAALKK